MRAPRHLLRAAGAPTRALLRRLTGRPEPALPAAAGPPRERELTVMFTDIAGFTGLAEELPPVAVAELLARHFGLLAASIERERGVVDKVWGDGLMALWDAGGDAATAPAVRAAAAIRQAVGADNAARAARGLPPVRLRVGLHAGPLVMAPLGGGAGLGGLTPLGDTVNVAQRLEDAARHVADPGRDAVTVLASEAVVARAGGGFRFEALGALPVRGRGGPVRAFRLAG
jgi:adenylate cyclase